MSILICVVAWLVLLSIKICNGIVVLGKACIHVTAYRELQARAEYDLYRRRMVEKKSKSVPNSPKISLVDFSDVLHQTAGVKGYTISDLINQWDDLELTNERKSVERDRDEQRPPRRTQSLAQIETCHKRDKSEPPSAIPEAEEKSSKDDSSTTTEKGAKEKEKVDAGPISPKKKMAQPSTDCEGLADVTAYKMLPAEQGVQRIE
ncbi:unnamed protein product [Cylicostephanus goldi]|uniref:Uncharacterized protein n=1 Tax=Cylicostephanus goldi TaxID=71465 RepID=A0A3P6RLL4_CYLGO|nr:unnamed protein product [Cylicostephanus goldi]